MAELACSGTRTEVRLSSNFRKSLRLPLRECFSCWAESLYDFRYGMFQLLIAESLYGFRYGMFQLLVPESIYDFRYGIRLTGDWYSSCS